MAEWNVGDEVVLKSGGPVMTVRKIHSDGVDCEWFDGEELKGHGFVFDQLMIPPESGPHTGPPRLPSVGEWLPAQ